MHLVEFQQTPCNLRMHPRRRILGNFFLLTTPSAVHLTTCFLPDSHHHRLAHKSSFAVISASIVSLLLISIGHILTFCIVVCQWNLGEVYNLVMFHITSVMVNIHCNIDFDTIANIKHISDFVFIFDLVVFCLFYQKGPIFDKGSNFFLLIKIFYSF